MQCAGLMGGPVGHVSPALAMANENCFDGPARTFITPQFFSRVIAACIRAFAG